MLACAGWQPVQHTMTSLHCACPCSAPFPPPPVTGAQTPGRVTEVLHALLSAQGSWHKALLTDLTLADLTLSHCAVRATWRLYRALIIAPTGRACAPHRRVTERETSRKHKHTLQ